MFTLRLFAVHQALLLSCHQTGTLCRTCCPNAHHIYHLQTRTTQQLCPVYKPLDHTDKAPAVPVVRLSHLPTFQCPLLTALVRPRCVSFSNIAYDMQHLVCMQIHVAQLIPSLHICTVFAVRRQLQQLRCRSHLGTC